MLSYSYGNIGIMTEDIQIIAFLLLISGIIMSIEVEATVFYTV